MIAMSTLLDHENRQDVGKGVEDFAEDIRDLLAFSSAPQRYQDIKDHFKEDDNRFEEDGNYFEEDLEYVREALIYLKDEGQVKQDFRLDGEYPVTAYSISDYDAI